MLRLIKKIPPHFFLLNVVALTGYFLTLSNLKAGINPEIMFSTPDSVSYMDVANWMLTGEDTIYVEYRPMLFPLILLILSKIGGAAAIWFFQFLLWLLSVNLLFESIRKITGKVIFAYFGALILIGNLSVINYTLHALTEITTLFLLSFLIYFFSKNSERRKELYFIHRIILFFVALTLIKPVFFIPLLFILGITPVFYFRNYLKTPVKLATLALILLPFIAQLTVMKVKYNSFSVSNISGITFTRYLLTQGIQEIEKIEDRDKAMEIAEAWSPEEQKTYFMNHFGIYKEIFWDNVEVNIKVKPTLMLYPVGYENHSLATKMERTNGIYYSVHKIFILLSSVLLLLLLLKKMYTEALLLFCIYGLGFYYIFVTGISSYQGDRLVIAVVPVWIFLYLFVIHTYLKLAKDLYKRRFLTN